jgi:hypothetical protein
MNNNPSTEKDQAGRAQADNTPIVLPPDQEKRTASTTSQIPRWIVVAVIVMGIFFVLQIMGRLLNYNNTSTLGQWFFPPTITPTPLPTYVPVPGDLAIGRHLCNGVPRAGVTVYLLKLPENAVADIKSDPHGTISVQIEDLIQATTTTDVNGVWHLTENAPTGWYFPVDVSRGISIVPMEMVKELSIGHTADFGVRNSGVCE